MKVEAKNIDKYLQACMEYIQNTNTIVYYTEIILGVEAKAVKQCMALIIRYKLKQDYDKMCGFVRFSMALSIVLFNTVILRGTQEKEVYICKGP